MIRRHQNTTRTSTLLPDSTIFRAEVTGVDAAAENVAAARAHAMGSGLSIDYREGELATLGLGAFDLVTSMEVLEHVADKPAFLCELARRSEEHTSELQSLIRTSYAVFFLKKKKAIILFHIIY